MWEKLTDKKARNFISKVEKSFKDLPHLPQGLVEFFVKIAPWGVGLGAFFSLTGAITNFRFGLGMSPMGRVMRYYAGGISPIYFILNGLLQLALAIIAFKAFGLLKDRKIEGWIYIFWSNAIAVLESILGFLFLGGSGMSLLVGALIGYYLLFEMKPAYEPKKKTKKDSKPKKK